MTKENRQTIKFNQEFDNNLDINNTKLETQKIEETPSYNTQKIEEEMLKIVKKDKKPKNVKNLIGWILMVFFLVIWILIVSRVPYIGTFFDGVFFEFIFGWSKYLLYLLSFILILSIKVKPISKFVFSKRKILWYLAIVFLFSITLNMIHFYKEGYNLQNYSNLYSGKNGYLNNWNDFFWLRTIKTFDVSYSVNLTPYHGSWGGLLGLFVVSSFTFISPILLLLIFLFVLFVLGTKLFNKKHNIKWLEKFKNKIIRKLGGFTKEEINIKLGETLNTEIDNNNSKEEIDFLNENSDTQELKKEMDSIIPIINTMNTIDVFNEEQFSDINFVNNTLTRKLKRKFDLSKIEESKNLIVNYKFEKLDNIKSKIERFIKLESFDYQFVGEEIRLQSIRLKYLFTNFDNMLEIQKSNKRLQDFINEKDVITYIGQNNELVVEVVLKESSQATLNEELSRSKEIVPYNVPIGKNDQFTTQYINLIVKTNLLIYGCIGSGKSMGLSSILSYLLAISNKSFLRCEIIDLTGKTLKTFSNLDSEYLTYKTTDVQLIETLDFFIERINEYNALLGDNFSNIYKYNDSVTFDEIIKNQVIVINDLNLINSQYRNEVIKKIIKLLKHAKKFGFIIMITSSEINDDIKQLEKYMNSILYFKLDELSEAHLDDNNWKAKYLVGKGDMLLNLEGNIQNLQSFIIKKDEIHHLFEIEE